MQGATEGYLCDGGREEGGQEGSPQPRKQEQRPGGKAQKTGMKRPSPQSWRMRQQ